MSNYSKWRESFLSIKGGQVAELNMFDTRPNVFYIVNSNNTKIYCSMSTIASSELFDYIIKPNTSDAFGRPLPVAKLTVYNPSKENISLKIYSDFQNFDVGLLKSLTVDIDKAIADTIKGDGILKGVEKDVEVPIIDKNIINQLKATRKINTTNILKADSNCKGIDISSSTEINFNRINFLQNDGEESINISIWDLDYMAINSILLKAGECLTDVKLNKMCIRVADNSINNIRYLIEGYRGNIDKFN